MTQPPLPFSNRFSEFKTFDEPALKAALDQAKFFVEQVKHRPQQGRFITFIGTPGTGKTLMAKTIFRELGFDAWGRLSLVPCPMLPSGRDAEFRSWRRISDALKDGKFHIMRSLETPFCLCLDDIGADYDPSTMVAAKLDGLLRARSGKWTVITSNLSLGQLHDIDARIASFLVRDGNTVVNMKGVQDFSLRRNKTT